MAGVYERITFIGAGKMAQALINPLITTGVQPAENITFYDVSKSTMKSISDEYQGKTGTRSSIQNAVEGADLSVMAVKPQNVGQVYAEIKKAEIREDCTLLSVIARKPVQVRLCARIINHNFIIQYRSSIVPISNTFSCIPSPHESFIGGTGIHNIPRSMPNTWIPPRSMPNTPAQFGQGITVLCATPNIKAEEREKIDSMLYSFGKSLFVIDIAHVFLIMTRAISMIDAGVHMGFSREQATYVVDHTLLGSTVGNAKKIR